VVLLVAVGVSQGFLAHAPLNAKDLERVAGNPMLYDLGYLIDFWSPLHWHAPQSGAQKVFWPLSESALQLLVIGLDGSVLLMRAAAAAGHLAAAVLLLRLLREVFPGEGVAPFLGALFFAVHPGLIETVATISDFREILGALFGLGSLYYFVRSFREPDPLLWRNAAFLCTACLIGALLASSAGLAVPFLMAIIAWMRPEAGARGRRRVRASLLLVVLYVALVWRFVPPRRPVWPVRADAVGAGLRALVSASTLGSYWLEAWLPCRDAAAGFSPAEWYRPSHIALAAAAVAAAGAAGMASLRRREWRLGLLWTPVALLPAAYCFPISILAPSDARLYWPTAGVCVLLGLALSRLAAAGRVWRSVALAAGLQSVFMGLSAHRSMLCARPYLLARAAYRHAPDDLAAMLSAADALLRQERPEAALPVLRGLERRLPRRSRMRALALAGTGRALRDTGRNQEAVDRLRRAVAIDPTIYGAQLDLGQALIALGRNAEALGPLNIAHAVNTATPEPLYYMALAHEKRRRPLWARVYARYALERDPDHGPSRDLLARLDAKESGPGR